MSPTYPVLSELADFLRFRSALATCDEFTFRAVNRRVASSSLARGAKSILSVKRHTSWNDEAGEQNPEPARFMSASRELVLVRFEEVRGILFIALESRHGQALTEPSLELLSRSSLFACRPFGITLLHLADVCW